MSKALFFRSSSESWDSARLVGGAEHHRRSDARVQCKFPPAGAHAPPVAGLEAGKSELRNRAFEIVPLRAGEGQELLRHLGADHMRPSILGPRLARARAEETGHGRRAARRQRLSKNVPVIGHGVSPSVHLSGRLTRTPRFDREGTDRQQGHGGRPNNIAIAQEWRHRTLPAGRPGKRGNNPRHQRHPRRACVLCFCKRAIRCGEGGCERFLQKQPRAQ